MTSQDSVSTFPLLEEPLSALRLSPRQRAARAVRVLSWLNWLLICDNEGHCLSILYVTRTLPVLIPALPE